jgi:lambda repressor-like predicted transcriptional regulator
MNKVRSLLDKRGWTVSDLMRKSGLAMGTCHMAATSPDWPTEGVNWGTIETIADALGVSPIDLLSDNNKGD